MANVGNADVVVRLALEQLNADLVKAAQQIQAQLKDAEVGVRINTDSAAEQAKQAGLTVQEAIDQGIAKIDSSGRLRDLSGRFIKVGEDGRIAGEEVAKAFEGIGGSSSGIVDLASTLQSSYAEAQKFAQGLGLTAEQANTAIQKIQQLDAVSATTSEKFEALNQELGITERQFSSLATAADTSRGGVAGIADRFVEATSKAGQYTLGLQVVSQQLTQTGQRITDFSSQAQAAAIAFDSAKAAVTTLGADGEATGEAMRQLAKDLNNNVNSTELLKSSYDVLSARTETLTQGLSDAQVATNILKAATIGAIGGFSDTNTVADAVTSTLNAYGESADKAGAYVDKFAATQNAGKITIAQYAEQIGRLAPTAAQAGVGIDELNGFIATATVKGVPVESTFAGIRQAIASTLKPSEDAKKQAKELGIEFGPLALRSKGLAGIIGELNAKGADTPDVLLKLFGSVEAVTAIAPAAGAGFKSLKQNIDASANSAGVAQKAYDAVANSAQGKMTQALNQANEALVSLGNGVENAAAPLVSVLGFLIEKFNELPEPVKEFVGVAIALTGGALTLAGALAGLAAVLPIVAAGAVATGEAFGVMAASLLAVAPLLIAVAAGVAAVKFTEFVSQLGEVNAQLDAFATQSEANGNRAIATASQIKDAVAQRVAEQKKGIAATQDEIKADQELLRQGDGQLKFLKDQLAAIQAIKPANDDQKQAQANLVQQYQLSINALEGQTKALKDALDATGAQTDALNEQGDALDSVTSKYDGLTNAVESGYKERQIAIANAVASGNLTEEQARAENYKAEEDYLSKRVGLNKEKLGELQQAAKNASKPEDAKKIQSEITKTEKQGLDDRLKAAQDAAAERTRLDQDKEKAAKKADQEEKKAAEEQKKAAQEAVQSVESANKRAEASIATSQANRIAKVKEAQLQGVVTEEQAASQIAQIAIDTTSKTIAQKQKELAEIRKLRANGSLDARQAADKESALNNEVAQLNEQLIEKQIEAQKRAKEAALKEVEDSNRRAEAAITQSQANRVAAIKQAQLEGVLSEKDAQNQITQVEVESANQTIAQKQTELAKVRQLRAQGVLSAQEAADKETALVTEIAQANQARIDKEISAQKALREQVLETLQLEQTNPLQAQEGRLEAIAASLQNQLNLAQAGADLEAKKGQLQEEQLKTQIKIAEASGNQQAAAQLNVQLQQLSAQNEEKQYQAKLKTLAIQQKLKETELQEEAIKAQIAKIEADINVQKAIAEGKTQQEIQQLQIIAGLRQQQLAQAQQSIQAQQQLFDIQKQSLDADRQIGLEQQKQNAIGGASGAGGAGQSASGSGGIASFGLGSAFGLGPNEYARSSPKGGGVSYSRQSTADSSPNSSSSSTGSSTAATGEQSNPIVDAVGKSGDQITSKLDEVIKAIGSPGADTGADTGAGNSDSASGSSINDRVKQFQKDAKSIRDQILGLQSTPAINLPDGTNTAAGAATSSQVVDAISKGNDAIVSTLKQVIDAINKTGSRPSVTVNGSGSTNDLLKWYNDMAIDHNRSCG